MEGREEDCCHIIKVRRLSIATGRAAISSIESPPVRRAKRICDGVEEGATEERESQKGRLEEEEERRTKYRAHNQLDVSKPQRMNMTSRQTSYSAQKEGMRSMDEKNKGKGQGQKGEDFLPWVRKKKKLKGAREESD